MFCYSGRLRRLAEPTLGYNSFPTHILTAFIGSDDPDPQDHERAAGKTPWLGRCVAPGSRQTWGHLIDDDANLAILQDNNLRTSKQGNAPARSKPRPRLHRESPIGNGVGAYSGAW